MQVLNPRTQAFAPRDANTAALHPDACLLVAFLDIIEWAHIDSWCVLYVIYSSRL